MYRSATFVPNVSKNVSFARNTLMSRKRYVMYNKNDYYVFNFVLIFVAGGLCGVLGSSSSSLVQTLQSFGGL